PRTALSRTTTNTRKHRCLPTPAVAARSRAMSDFLPLSAGVSGPRAPARLLGYSLIGLLLFFVPFEIAGRSTILLDHAASALQLHARPLVIALALLFMLYGALAPWIDGSWRRSLTHTVFSVLKVAGLLIGAAYLL